MHRRRRSPQLGNVVLYSVSSRRAHRGRLKWLLFASAVVASACALGWWVLSPGNNPAGPTVRAATNQSKSTPTPAIAATATPSPTSRATSTPAKSSPRVGTPGHHTVPSRPHFHPTGVALVSVTHHRSSPAVRLTGPPDRWMRAPAAGLAGIGKHVRIGTGQGSGPGWCLTNGGYPYGANVDGVWACGPDLGPPQPFDTDGFQCVELSTRFLWVVYGKIIRKVDSGADLVWLGHEQLHIPIGTPGPGQVPEPGDILSLSGPVADPSGHTAVVSAVNVGRQGNGSIQIMEENGSLSGWDHIDVRHWSESFGDPKYLDGYFHYTDISWLALAHANTPAPTIVPATTPSYSVVSLGANTSLAGSVSESGAAVGLADLVDKHHTPLHRIAFFNRGTRRVLLPPHGYQYMTMGSGIDAGLLIAGWGIHTGGDVRPYTVSPAKKIRWTQLPGENGQSALGQALSMTPSGAIAGWIAGALPGSSLAALWEPTTSGSYTLKTLHANRPFHSPLALGSDAYGDVVGSEMLGSRRTFGVVWTPNGVAHVLPSLYDRPEVDLANALLAQRKGSARVLTVVGSSGSWRGRSRAVKWHIRVTGSSMKIVGPSLLPLPRGYGGSAATSINGSGWIVGNLMLGSTATRAFLYRPGLGTVPLASLLPATNPWVIVRASSINSAGQIAGTGYRPGFGAMSRPQGLLLTPSPSHAGVTVR